MKNNNVKLITFIALVSILFLQWIWLYNTYILLEADFKKIISSLFIRSLEKEAVLRIEDPLRKDTWKQKVIKEFHPQNDPYTNNKALQDWLYHENYPFSLEKVDSIFKEALEGNFKSLDYSIFITDPSGDQILNIIHEDKNISNRFSYKETIQLRNIDPEYITLIITSPYKILFEEMVLLLIGSFFLSVIVVYGLILQIRIINRQNKIAELRQDFTHAMIHDMKNPVTSILMGINSLKSGKIDDKPQLKDRYYSIIYQEGEHILGLANKILGIAQFEEQRVVLSIQRINLSDLLASLIEKYQLNPAKKIHFHIELNNVEHFNADLHYIYEAFSNLIDNAIKYSKVNEDVEIYITSVYKDNNIQIIFKDTGIGISAKDQKIIFKKFERSLSVIKNQKKISGFGLGLNYVYQVIKAHGGTIKVNSRLGTFSEFIINIPNDENDKSIIN